MQGVQGLQGVFQPERAACGIAARRDCTEAVIAKAMQFLCNHPLRAAGVVLYFSGGAVDDNRGAPIPGQQRGEVGDLVIGNPGEYVGESGLGIDA